MSSVAEGCRAVLLTAEPRDKVKAARALARAWRRGTLRHDFDAAMPDRPARPRRPELLAPSQMPKRGRAGSERGRIAMLHALAHIEFGAIDLAIDMADFVMVNAGQDRGRRPLVRTWLQGAGFGHRCALATTDSFPVPRGAEASVQRLGAP